MEVDRPRLAEAAVEDVVAAIELEAPPRLKLGVAAAPDDDEGVSRDVEVAAGAVNWPAPKRGVEVVVAAEGVAADKPKEVDAVVGFEADGNPKLKPPEEAAVVVVTTDPTFNDEFAAVEATPKLVRGFGAAGVDSALLVVVAAALPKPKENPDGAGDGAGRPHRAQGRQPVQLGEGAGAGVGLGAVTRVQTVAQSVVTVINQVQQVRALSHLKTALMKVPVGEELSPILKYKRYQALTSPWQGGLHGI